MVGGIHEYRLVSRKHTYSLRVEYSVKKSVTVTSIV